MTIADKYEAARAARNAAEAADLALLAEWVGLLREALPRVKWWVASKSTNTLGDDVDRPTGRAWVDRHCMYANLIDGYAIFFTTSAGHCSVNKYTYKSGEMMYTMHPPTETGVASVYYQHGPGSTCEERLTEAVDAIRAHRKGGAA